MSCELKLRYSSFQAAKKHMRSIQRRRRGGGGKVPVRVYRCDQCNGWHLTSQKFR